MISATSPIPACSPSPRPSHLTVRNHRGFWRSTMADAVKTITDIEGRAWVALDMKNKESRSSRGSYLYVIQVGNQVVSKGTVTVAK